ncbi:MAG: cob(I)yrinic acid a,c-diamide adenosyltransferase [Actinobacteria bacterium]|nr:cob(I)yrinic acid a,c-diamide adenosyltransferase [Actinomycetota bacterium]
MPHYTGKGDDGTTGLLYGGRVAKNAPAPAAYGAVDEAQAFVGLIRAEVEAGGELDALLVEVARDMWTLMGELATDPSNLHKLAARVTAEMVERVAARVAAIEERFEMPRQFVIPGENRVAALCDVARAVVRRAERASIAVAAEDSFVVPYLNRLSSLLWVLARWQEGGHSLPSRP